MTAQRNLARPVLAGRAGTDAALVPTAMSDGTVLAARITGAADAPVTAVLVHGWTQDHTSWDDVVAALAGTPVRVVAYDGRGHGWSDSAARATATIDQFADDLAEVIAGLVPHGRVVLAGHSLGGPVIMAFAERHPRLLRERVAGVALVATSAGGLGRDIFGLPAGLTAVGLAAQPLLFGVGSRARAAILTRHPGVLAIGIRSGFYGPGAATRHNRRRTAAQVGRSHPATVAALVGDAVRHDRLHTLAGLDAAPTVVLAGTKDGLCPMAHSRAIAAAMPHAELVVYPRAGHMLPYERPAEVAGQIARLAGAAAPTGTESESRR